MSAAGLILIGEEQVRSPSSLEDCPRLVDQLNDEEKRRINDGLAQSPQPFSPLPQLQHQT